MKIAFPSLLSITPLVALFIQTSLVAKVYKKMRFSYSITMISCGNELLLIDLRAGRHMQWAVQHLQVGVDIRLCKYTARQSNNSCNCCLGREHSSALFGQVLCLLKTYWSNWFLLGINRNHPSLDGFVVLCFIHAHTVPPTTHSQYEEAYSRSVIVWYIISCKETWIFHKFQFCISHIK